MEARQSTEQSAEQPATTDPTETDWRHVVVADRAWAEMLGYAETGHLPAGWDSLGFAAYLHDVWYPNDLPETDEGFIAAIKYLLTKPEEEFAKMDRAFEFAMRSELTRVLEKASSQVRVPGKVRYFSED